MRQTMTSLTGTAHVALTGIAIWAGIAGMADANVKLPALFTDHMVLQQGQQDRVWGWADPGESVKVTIAQQSHETKADDKGRWQVTLAPLSVGGAHTLAVQGKNKLEIQDVLVGEVWICSGQSNMEWGLKQAVDGDLEAMAAKFPQIRLISVPKLGTQEPQEDFKGSWSVCTPEAARDFSAVGFFFGRQLHQTLGVPIGLIDDAWGGSACEAWIRRDILAADPLYKPLMERWENTEKNIDQAMAKWNEAVAKAKADGKTLPVNQNPENQMKGNARPGNIYNGVLKPTIGYGIRGAIWYQGESNANRAYQYRALFPLMIKSWRDEWGQGDFPFYYVQLADYLAEKPEPGDSAWAELREAQTMTMDKLPNVGQAVIIDIGEGKDIHPKNKQDVGKRLARWALARDYGVSVPYRSPQYKSLKIDGNKATVTFDYLDRDGFRPFDVAEPRGFAIAGADKKWVSAKARITETNAVEVWSDAVSEPVAVRYAWADNPVCNLYSSAGLPVTPFRTDDWDGVTINNVK